MSRVNGPIEWRPIVINMNRLKRRCRLILKVPSFSLQNSLYQMLSSNAVCLYLSVFLSSKTQSPSFTSFLCSIFQLLLLITQFRKAEPCDVTEGTDTFPRSVTSPKDKYWPSEHFFTLFWSSFKLGGHNKAAVVITRSRNWSFCERLSHRGRNTLLSYASFLLYNQGWNIKTWKWIQYATSKGIYQTT